MRVLALDSSTRDGSVAFVDDGRVVVERRGDPARPHAERLPGELLAVLADAGHDLASIDLFAVAAGPGSFTGLRIGIAAIQGLAMVTGRRIVALSLLDVLAHVAAGQQPAGVRVGAWIDAYRHEVFSALFTVGAGEPFAPERLQLVDPPRTARPEAIMAAWVSQPPALVIGNGAVLYADRLSSFATPVTPPPLAGPLGLLATVRARLGETLAPSAVQPFYIRRPDVELARERAGN